MKFLLVVLFTGLWLPALCQQNNAALLLSEEKQVSESESQNRSESFLSKVVKAPFKGSLLFYQKLISPNLNSRCGYHISCSRFSGHAIAKKGIIRGIFLTADRLSRCTPQAVDDAPSHRISNEGKIHDIDLYLE